MGELFNIQILEDRWCEKWSPGEDWALLFLFFLVSVAEGGADPLAFLGFLLSGLRFVVLEVLSPSRNYQRKEESQEL